MLFAIALVLVVTSTVFAAGSGESPTAGPIEMVFVHQHIPFNISAAELFKEEVESESDGAIEVTLLHWEALGGDRDVIEQLELGDIHATQATTGGLAGIWPDVMVLGWPFLFEDREVAWYLFEDDSYLEFMRDQLFEASGGSIRLFGGAENAIRHFYSTKGPVRVPSDLAEHNIKMRTRSNPFDVTLWETLGVASAVSVPASDRYTALQTGLMDAAEGGPASNWEAGIMEIADYMTLTGHSFAHHFYVMNNEFYESLSSEHQRIIDDAMHAAIWHQNEQAQIENDEAVNTIRDAGNTVYQPTLEEAKQWQDAAKPVAERFLGEELSASVVEETFAALERTRQKLGR